VILRPVLIVGLRTAVYASQCIFPNALVSFRALPLLALPTVSLGRTHRRRAAGRIVVRARLRSRQRGAPTGSAWSGGGSNTDGPGRPWQPASPPEVAAPVPPGGLANKKGQKGYKKEKKEGTVVGGGGSIV